MKESIDQSIALSNSFSGISSSNLLSNSHSESNSQAVFEADLANLQIEKKRAGYKRATEAIKAKLEIIG